LNGGSDSIEKERVRNGIKMGAFHSEKQRDSAKTESLCFVAHSEILIDLIKVGIRQIFTQRM